MTEIEKRALALVNEVTGSGSWTMTNLSHPYNRVLFQALCRAIEQHEAFKQEVSDAVEDYCGYVPPDSPCHPITRFIIPKPDPLVDAVQDWWDADGYNDVANLRAAIAKRGGKIVWGEG